MAIVIRRMRLEDARSFLEVHRAAVRGIAATDYAPVVIEAWAPLPITDKVVENFLANPENELRLVAEVAGEIVGIGAIVLEKAELRACYVMPKMVRKGVGSALVREIERIANKNNLTHLEMDASVNSEPFYTALAFEIKSRGDHILQSGERMACVKMRKTLGSRITSTD
jgi:putative acetyltransferase